MFRKTRNSPVAASAPRFAVSRKPRFFALRRGFTRGSAAAHARSDSAVPSVEASSTTMISPRKLTGSVSTRLRRHASVTATPLWHGMMIETVGPAASGDFARQTISAAALSPPDFSTASRAIRRASFSLLPRAPSTTMSIEASR